MKYKLANGWTKEKVIKQVKKYNNGNRAYDPTRGCLYETENENRCEIGCFIPDFHRGLKFSGDVKNLLENHTDLINKMPFDNIEALTEFQKVHDKSNTFEVYQVVETFLKESVE